MRHWIADLTKTPIVYIVSIAQFSILGVECQGRRGMLQNPLCSFWEQELSEVWAGTQIGKEHQIKYNGFMNNPSPERRRWVTVEEIEVRPQAFAILPEYERGIITGFKVQDPEGYVIRQRARLVGEIHSQYPAVSIEELDNARISYFDYHAIVRLKR